MIINEKDLQMVAEALVEMFGDEAVNRATERAEEYRKQGNSEGQRFWLDTGEAIKRVLRERHSDS